MNSPLPTPPAPKSLPPLFNRGQKLYVLIRTAHQQFVKLMQSAHEALDATRKTDEGAADCVNLANCCRQSKKYLAEMTKDIAAMEAELERLVCMHILSDISNENAKIETEYCVATADIGHNYVVPTFDKDPEQYAKLMEWLGVDPGLWDRGKELTEEGENATKVLDLHWPGFQYLCKRLKQNGYNPPPGVDPERAYPVYKLGIRTRKPIA